MNRNLIVIAYNMRSAHNVGSLLRTCDGIGVAHVYLTGYTPYPSLPGNDARLPHIVNKLNSQINKTALGAEESQAWSHYESLEVLLQKLKAENIPIVALEQASSAVKITDYTPPNTLALLLGPEVEGLHQSELQQCDNIIELPMFGKKESFNVVQAAAMALFYCRFYK